MATLLMQAGIGVKSTVSIIVSIMMIVGTVIVLGGGIAAIVGGKVKLSREKNMSPMAARIFGVVVVVLTIVLFYIILYPKLKWK
ncbi:MAG: hypothetical protein QGH94_00205 [Phycisphaerae bacterium]|nr:hypothetical protein [Phycisphaerae bacterium]MDP7286389.1 hypothetical protein [Phycisphaerae bacterium]